MSRLFLGQKESDFFSDITKELIKDVAGQKIYYYQLREDLTNTNNLYSESQDKIFDPPVEVECLVEWGQAEVKTSKFGHETLYDVTVYLHPRDLLDRNLEIRVGDYFSYGPTFFESTSIAVEKFVKGQVERIASYKMKGKPARLQHINVAALGPTSEQYTDPDAIQTTFEQQRGFNESDKRQLRADGVLEAPITGPKKIAPDGTTKSINGIGTGFYGDDE
jgi:hypothetical protein